MDIVTTKSLGELETNSRVVHIEVKEEENQDGTLPTGSFTTAIKEDGKWTEIGLGTQDMFAGL